MDDPNLCLNFFGAGSGGAAKSNLIIASLVQNRLIRLGVHVNPRASLRQPPPSPLRVHARA
jgi:hypothetical protein